MSTPSPFQLLSQRAAAREFGINEDELKAAREAGKIPFRRHGRAIQMRRIDIEHYVASTLTGDIAPAIAPPPAPAPSDPDWAKKIRQEVLANYNGARQ